MALGFLPRGVATNSFCPIYIFFLYLAAGRETGRLADWQTGGRGKWRMPHKCKLQFAVVCCLVFAADKLVALKYEKNRNQMPKMLLGEVQR